MGNKVAAGKTTSRTMGKIIYPVKTAKEHVYKFKKKIMDYDTAVKTAKEMKI